MRVVRGGHKSRSNMRYEGRNLIHIGMRPCILSSLEAILTCVSHIPVVRGVGRNKINFCVFFYTPFIPNYKSL